MGGKVERMGESGLGRRDILADEREAKIDLFGNVLHSGDDEVTEAVFGIGAFGHDVGF